MLEAGSDQHPDHVPHRLQQWLPNFRRDLFRQIDKFNLAMIEQPLQHDDLIDHARTATTD